MRYDRILTRLIGTPLAISENKLEVINKNITFNLLQGKEVSSIKAFDQNGQSEKVSSRYSTAKAVNIINVFDSLAAKNAVGDSGVTTYESLTNQINFAIDKGYKDIIFYIDSPGGEAAGLFGFAEFVRSLSTKYGINTVAFSDGYATSAAYVIGAATNKFFATSSAMLGSIGVIMTLADMTEADAKDGVKYTILRSKEEKALINPHENLSAEALTKAEGILASLDSIMNKTVSSFRPGLTIDSIKNMKGDSFLAKDALKLGLIDGIVSSFDEILFAGAAGKKIVKQKTMGNTNMNETELQTQLLELKAENASLKAQLQTSASTAKQNEKTRVLKIISDCKTLDLDMSLAVKRIEKDTSAEDALEMFSEYKELLQGQTIVPTVGSEVPSINPKTVETPTSFVAQLDAALEKLGDKTSTGLFQGIN